MPGPALTSTVRGAVDAIRTHMALLTIVGGGAALVLVAAAVGAPLVVLPVLAALPLLLGIGRQNAFVLVVALLLVRTLADNSGSKLVSIGLAMAITGLAVLVLLASRGVAAPAGALLAYFFASAAAGASSHGASVTFGEAFRLTSAVAVVLIAAHAPGRRTVERLSYAVQLIAIVPALLAIYQLATGTGSDIAGTIRSNGTLFHPNSAAMLFATANLVTFARVVQQRSGRSVQVALLGVFLVAQASTGSVGGIAAMTAMVLTYLFARSVRRADRIALTTAAMGAGAALVLTSSIGVARLAEFADPRPGKPNSFEWRLSAWTDVLAAWRKHVLLGNGLGSTLAKTIVPGNLPHNEYVRLLAEVGLIGFLLIVALGVGFAMSIARLGRTSTQPQAAALALAALGGTALNALAANTILYSASFYVTMLVVGSCWRVLRDSQTSNLATGSVATHGLDRYLTVGPKPSPAGTLPAAALRHD